MRSQANQVASGIMKTDDPTHRLVIIRIIVQQNLQSIPSAPLTRHVNACTRTAICIKLQQQYHITTENTL